MFLSLNVKKSIQILHDDKALEKFENDHNHTVNNLICH